MIGVTIVPAKRRYAERAVHYSHTTSGESFYEIRPLGDKALVALEADRELLLRVAERALGNEFVRITDALQSPDPLLLLVVKVGASRTLSQGFRDLVGYIHLSGDI